MTTKKENKTVVVNSTAEVKNMVKEELNLPTTTKIETSSDDTLATLSIKAFATVLMKTDKQTVIDFKTALSAHVEKQKQAVDKAVAENKFDKNNLPRVSAPNDLYNTIAEGETLLKLILPNNDRVEVAANTVRQFIAETCKQINEYKKANACGSAPVKSATKTTTAVDSEYATI